MRAGEPSPGRGSAEVQQGIGLRARVTQERGELSNACCLQQTLHVPLQPEPDSSDSTSSSAG